MIYWKKLGQLFVPNTTNRHPKLLTHAANPLPIHLNKNVFRVFYSGRDEFNRSSVGAVDIDISTLRVVKIFDAPIFEHGILNSFFADGISIGNVYEANGQRYMLFMGWQRPSNGHWRGDIGRFLVTPELNLIIDSPNPFMGSNSVDPISLSYPWVEKKASGGYDMWYGSTHTWDGGNGEMIHAIHHATSDDGHKWERHGIAVPFKLGVAQAFSRPTVAFNEDGSAEMWFSYRSGTGEKYRIGYAKRVNGTDWLLDLEGAGISVSDDGWDSEMIEYPFVFDHNGKRYMMYNGNGYGKTGFGLAVLEE